jgi:hypothetical protein
MSLNQENMTSIEKRAAMSLSAIFASRMLGLFMVLPGFAFYAKDLDVFRFPWDCYLIVLAANRSSSVA